MDSDFLLSKSCKIIKINMIYLNFFQLQDRDIWPSLKSIFLNSVDSDIRDYVAIELNSLSLLDAAELDSWKFLILVEGILKDTNL